MHRLAFHIHWMNIVLVLRPKTRAGLGYLPITGLWRGMIRQLLSFFVWRRFALCNSSFSFPQLCDLSTYNYESLSINFSSLVPRVVLMYLVHSQRVAKGVWQGVVHVLSWNVTKCDVLFWHLPPRWNRPSLVCEWPPWQHYHAKQYEITHATSEEFFINGMSCSWLLPWVAKWNDDLNISFYHAWLALFSFWLTSRVHGLLDPDRMR